MLLADRVPDDVEPAVIEDEARRLGAALVVLPRRPGRRHEPVLRERRWTVASAWYLGRPA